MRFLFWLLWVITAPGRLRREVVRSIRQHIRWPKKQVGRYTTLD